MAISTLRNFASEFRADLRSGKGVPALSAGFTSGLGLLVAQVAFGSFIFSGPLASYSSQGVGLVLFGNFAVCLVIALTSSYRGVIAGLSPALVLVMALIGSWIDAEGDALFVTTAVALIISAVVTGLCCLLIGHFGLANLMRFIPFPVAGGFVAGIGGAVCLAAMSLMGAELKWWKIPALIEPPVLWKWIPGVVYGIALYLAMKRWGNPQILSVSVALAVAAYHLALAGLGISGDEARAEGLLLKSTAEGSLWPSSVARRFAAGGMDRNRQSDPPHADVDSGRFHLCGPEFCRPRVGCESGVGLGPGVPCDRGRECGRRSGRRYGGDHCRASVPAQQVARGHDAADGTGRRPWSSGRRCSWATGCWNSFRHRS